MTLSQSPSAVKQREAYAANPEKYRQQASRWKAKNPEKANLWAKNNRDKVNARAAKRRIENPENCKAVVRRHYLKNLPKILVNAALQRSRKYGYQCTISAADIVIPSSCPVLGIPIVAASGRMADTSPTIDRIDPAKGYVPGNVIVISWRANRLRSDGTLNEMRAILAFYEKIGAP